jgi:FtsZ-interacting cell division protein YlmF
VTYLDKYAHCCKCEDAEELDEEKSPVQYLKKKKHYKRKQEVKNRELKSTRDRSKHSMTRQRPNSVKIKTINNKTETKLDKDQRFYD